MSFPRYIGICGNPKSGKSEVQKILSEQFGYSAVDDGYVLREFAVEKLGLSWDDVQTQEGKARYSDILGKNWQHRDILGTLGNHLEQMFGEHIMPFIATRSLSVTGRYSFGSVRKTQGEFFRANGGIVLGIRNSKAPASPYAFDWFDPDLVDVWIDNEGLQNNPDDMKAARRELENAVVSAISSFVTVAA